MPNNPTAPTLEEWEVSVPIGYGVLRELAEHQIAYLRSRPAERPELTDEMIEAAREVRSAYGNDNAWSRRMMLAMHRFDEAFAFVLHLPAPPKERTMFERTNSTLTSGQWATDERALRAAVTEISIALDALTARLEKMDGKP